MTAGIVNHLWQSTLVVFAAASVAFMLRRNRASARHAVWLAASVKFLLPFSLLVDLGGVMSWRSTPEPSILVAPSIVTAAQIIAAPFPEAVMAPVPARVAPQSTPIPWRPMLLGLWAIGSLVVIVLRIRAWQSVRVALRSSAPASLPDVESPINVRATPGLLEPGVVGIWRPVLLVPVGLEATLTADQLRAVVTHELHHIRRRDNLTSALHMAVETVFWFHPLVWWVGSRLIDERERACDEHVLSTGAAPDAYAEGILNICKRYVESPVACVSGVSGSDLKRRIAAILINRVGRRLDVGRKTVLAMVATLAIVLPFVVGLLLTPLNVSAFAQTSSAQVPTFDVVSVKPCDDNSPSTTGRSGGANQASPGYLNLSCLTLRQLISRAYLFNPVDRLRNRKWEEQFVEGYSPFIRGGPSWVNSDKWTVEAKAAGVTDQATLTGPMLRGLLEDRFRVKTHRASEERTMLALTVANTGFKITPDAPDSCYAVDAQHLRESAALKPAGKEICGMATGDAWGSHQYVGVWLGAAPDNGWSDHFVDQLWRLLLQPIIDRTGLHGRYSFSLEFTPDENTPGVRGRCGGSPDCIARLAANGISDERPTTFKSNATIYKALEDLGLKLEKTKAASEYLVIDRAERPRPDAPQSSLHR